MGSTVIGEASSDTSFGKSHGGPQSIFDMAPINDAFLESKTPKMTSRILLMSFTHEACVCKTKLIILLVNSLINKIYSINLIKKT